MLPKTFVHLPGIGSSTEKKLWDGGIWSWAQLLDSASRYFKGRRLEAIQQALDSTIQAWERRDLLFFYRHLPRNELWRLVPGFFDQIAFLDIETDGLNLPPYSQSTTVTFYFRGQVHQAHERSEKERLVRWMIEESPVWCTYFGEVFDLPFLRREFGLALEMAHLDLCFWLKRHGFNGGLKKVERCFEDIPRRQSMDIGGLDAVRLWDFHCRGVPQALETLLAYNAEDTIVLEPLLIKAFNFEVGLRPHLLLEKLPMKPPPSLPTEVCPEIYARLRAGSAGLSSGVELRPR